MYILYKYIHSKCMNHLTYINKYDIYIYIYVIYIYI